jgi:hypothetical protein
MPYSKIAAVLNEKYQLNIALSGVYDFFKRRVTKKPRQYKYEALDIVLPEEPKQPEAPPVQKAKDSKPFVEEKPKQEEKKENVTVSKPSVQEKPKQEEKEKIDIDKIIAELENHKLEYHDLASGYQPKYYTPEVAKLILERIKAKNQLKKEEEKK